MNTTQNKTSNLNNTQMNSTQNETSNLFFPKNLRFEVYHNANDDESVFGSFREELEMDDPYGYRAPRYYRQLTSHERTAMILMGFLVLVPFLVVVVGRKLAIWRWRQRQTTSRPMELPRWCSNSNLHRRNRISNLAGSLNRISLIGSVANFGSNRNLIPLINSNEDQYRKKLELSQTQTYGK